VLLRANPPAGIILFARNIQDPAQLRLLMASLRAVLPPCAVILVDQEGGRVARLRPPHWLAHPSAGAIGALFDADPRAGLRAAWLTGALIGLDCRAAGFDVVCAPVLDRRLPDAAAVIGDRSYGETPASIVGLARAMAAGLLAAGVQPVGKHAPRHPVAAHHRRRDPWPAGLRRRAGLRRPGDACAARRSGVTRHRLPGRRL
jgi:beta-N-acetylhexosaminidase